ncbi:PemK-like, MazF-like toxin of type II toxin-antitoxin system [Rhodococcoides kroppenstedtii]|uniref:PemK-like, MazF-like toxin of type II toxin-antitoxin system n=1 Tax=Rhodococcoides kroppenstedtii TaxID=293050 RepID=A0A1I0SIM8_9NOCA|nr:type II toxin-antitoxin system PemK/MazF family toxin [Rhodococcus kroppenstedtii]SFA39322.1 PemK-like, MazF-like toxin of type II toxin-antitoxin system [Rhodococcus kroppenstedtii]
MPTLGQIGKKLGRLAVAEGPRLFRQLQRSGALDRVQEQLAGRRPSAPSAPAGRPVSTTSAPTAARARRIEYAPALDGAADPGEIVWTWVAYEEDPSQGKDRPVLVVGRDGATLLGLMLSSKNHDGDRDWLAVGSGPWDAQGRPSWLRLDRVLDVPEAGIRREGAIFPREKFDAVATRLKSQFSWH